MASSEEKSLKMLQSWFTDSTMLEIEVSSPSVAPGVPPGMFFQGEGTLSNDRPGYVEFAIGASGAIVLRLGMHDKPVLDSVSGTITISSRWGSCVLKPKVPSVFSKESERIQ
jgi:hypothetical protein